jgi:hypothetical protein
MGSKRKRKMSKPKKSKQIRPLGHVLLDMEPFFEELLNDHDLQWGDVLGLVYFYLQVHYPKAREEYESGGHPEMYYGPPNKKGH